MKTKPTEFIPDDAFWVNTDYWQRVTLQQARYVLMEKVTMTCKGKVYYWRTRHIGCGIYELFLEPMSK